jgi:hypothetical protein
MSADLNALLDERAITRPLVDYCRACDRFDIPLLRSVYHPDATVEHGMFDGSATDFCDFVEKVAGIGSPYKVTQHSLTNIAIDLHGDWAHVESYVTAYHCREDDSGRFDEFIGGRYVDRFERRGGVWKIAHRATVYEWSRVEPATQRFWEQSQWQDADQFIRGRRDRTDPVYANVT